MEVLFIAAIYALCAIYLGFALGRQVERVAWEQRLCSHRWEYRSLDNLDHFWQRICLDCGYYEKLKPEQVPHNERCKARNYPRRDP